jgi:hypothetical protein
MATRSGAGPIPSGGESNHYPTSTPEHNIGDGRTRLELAAVRFADRFVSYRRASASPPEPDGERLARHESEDKAKAASSHHAPEKLRLPPERTARSHAQESDGQRQLP